MLVAVALLSVAVLQQTVERSLPPREADHSVRDSRTRTTPVDSVAVLRRARGAQAEFERERRAALPVRALGAGGRCDVRVGRLCYWHDEHEPEGPPEPRRIAEARERLLTRLASAATRLPGDAWITGQRVRYLVEQGRAADAVAVARTCEGAAWWCASLAGLALHSSGDYAEADSAVDAALATMPPAERCHWSDVSPILDDPLRDRYERLSCAQRADFERRFWALSRPLYLVPGNDRRTEHFARVTMARIQGGMPTTHGLTWGDDVRELMIRYGWPTRWSRDVSSSLTTAEPRVVGHDPTPSYAFAPSVRAYEDPLHAEERDWRLDDPAARERHAPRYAKTFVELLHQAARFRRGDSARVVVAFDVARDTLFPRDSIQAALAVIAIERDSVNVIRRAAAPRHAVFDTMVPWAPTLLSVELLDTTTHHAARARFPVHPPPDDAGSALSLSDLLLLERAEPLPTTLDEAIPRARGALRVRSAEPLGLYWELYGAREARSTIAYSLTVTRAGGDGWLRRAAASMRLVEQRTPVTMRWQDVTGGARTLSPRALVVDLSPLSAGRYWITLTAEVPGRAPVTVSREVAVER